jgi:dienelactone hydrolase
VAFNALRDAIHEFLRLGPAAPPPAATIHQTTPLAGYQRQRLSYPSTEGELIPAYRLIPEGMGPFPGLLIHHQHASQRHLGKSEVVGLAGDPLQAFGPELAARGFMVLAPDSICFEDRRRHASGLDPQPDDQMQHVNEMCYRLVRGDTLLRKVLADATQALDLLLAHPQVDGARLGVMGHSYGGNTTLFQAALDERLSFACASGALCSYAHKMAHEIGLEVALVVPGFAARWDMPHLLQCIAPRPLLGWLLEQAHLSA